MPSRTFAFDASETLTPVYFELQHGDEQTFEDVPAGDGYSITERAAEGWETTYNVSNGGTHDNITIGAGEIVTVTVTNTVPYEAIVRLRRSPHVNAEKIRLICRRFEIDLQQGLGTIAGVTGIPALADPTIMLRVSRDGGNTWGDEIQMHAGAIGEYAARTFATNLGQGRDFVFEVSVSDPSAAWALVNAYANFQKGTS